MNKILISFFIIMLFFTSIISAENATNKTDETKSIPTIIKEYNDLMKTPEKIPYSEAIQIISDANQALQSELDSCQADLSKNKLNKYIMYFSIILALIAIMWKTVDLIKKK